MHELIPHSNVPECEPQTSLAQPSSMPYSSPMPAYHYASSPIQRVPASAPVVNGITARENSAVQHLSAGQVNLHAMGASLQRVASYDPRLVAVQARSLAQGSSALVSHEADRGHELWHLAQQAMGRVDTTAKLNGRNLNTQPYLEAEADHQGALINHWRGNASVGPPSQAIHYVKAGAGSPIQRNTNGGAMEIDHGANVANATVAVPHAPIAAAAGLREPKKRKRGAQDLDESPREEKHQVVEGLVQDLSKASNVVPDHAPAVVVRERVQSAKRRHQESETVNDPVRASKRQDVDKVEPTPIQFNAGEDDEKHQIYANQSMDDLIVASDPTPLATIIASKHWLAYALHPPELSYITKTLQPPVKTALANIKNSPSKANNTALATAMRAVANYLSTISTMKIPSTDLTTSEDYGTTGMKIMGKKVVADPLSSKSAVAGSIAKDGDLMKSLRKVITNNGGDSKELVQAHLLNMKTWGPGELWNLTPASHQFNKTQEARIETPLKRAILDHNLVMYFKAEVNYGNYPLATSPSALNYLVNPQQYLFHSIKFTASQLHWDASKLDFVKKSPPSDHADIKALNKTLNWEQGKVTALSTRPNVHTETDPAAFVGLNFPKSVVEAITSYNDSVEVGHQIPGKLKGVLRKGWHGNVSKADFRDDLLVWINSASSHAKNRYTGSSKSINTSKLPSNWKKLLDFDL
jgi:hypothetical protein